MWEMQDDQSYFHFFNLYVIKITEQIHFHQLGAVVYMVLGWDFWGDCVNGKETQRFWSFTCTCQRVVPHLEQYEVGKIANSLSKMNEYGKRTEIWGKKKKSSLSLQGNYK